MKTAYLALFVSLVLLSSGCVRESGELVVDFEETVSPEALVIPEPESNESDPEEVAEPLDNETMETPDEDSPGNETTEDHDPCVDKLCDDSITTCRDGTVMTCGNACNPISGLCTSCIPDCSEHDQDPPEECDLTCGDCETLNQDKCSCSTKLFCDPNGICEPGNGEWPDGEDCESFDSCDDGDACTQDNFHPSTQTCSHIDTCCDDGIDCTVDVYNPETGGCDHLFDDCCGDGTCDPDFGESETSCPDDCFEEEELPGDVEIIDIDPSGDEIVTLLGYGVDMTGWTIEDISNTTYEFPDDFVIDGQVYLHTVGCPENDSLTDLYWGTKEGECRTGLIWNNDHDTATLWNDLDEVASIFEY
jgi:hypothetical protein